MSLRCQDGRGGAGTWASTVGGMSWTQRGLALLGGHSSPRPVLWGLQGVDMIRSSPLCCTHPTVDRFWAAGLSRVASAPVLAVTAKPMKTTTVSSRPLMRAPQRMGLPVNVVRGALGQGGGRVIPQDGVGRAGCELACHHRKTPRHQACSHPWDGSGSQWPGPRGLSG